MLKLWLIKYQMVSQNLAKFRFLAGSNSETIQYIMLKLTMSECLNRHYVRTNPWGSGLFLCVDLMWNGNIMVAWFCHIRWRRRVWATWGWTTFYWRRPLGRWTFLSQPPPQPSRLCNRPSLTLTLRYTSLPFSIPSLPPLPFSLPSLSPSPPFLPPFLPPLSLSLPSLPPSPPFLSPFLPPLPSSLPGRQAVLTNFSCALQYSTGPWGSTGH